MSQERVFRSGELARATGITVRTLHHYDRIGLLAPSSYTAGGHRCYTPDDVRRLHAILALRDFGLSLAEIAEALEAVTADPRDLVRRQLLVAQERLAQAQRLCRRLLDVLGALEELSEPSTTELIDLMEVMTTMNQPLTPEEVEAMSQRRREFREGLSSEELEDLNRRREEFRRSLEPDQLARMQERRAQLMPRTG